MESKEETRELPFPAQFDEAINPRSYYKAALWNTIKVIAGVCAIIMFARGAWHAAARYQATKTPCHKSDIDSSDTPTHDRVQLCPFEHYTNAYYYDFPSLDSFTFSETIETSQFTSSQVGGRIHLLEADEDQTEDIRVGVSFATTASWIVQEVDIEQKADGLYLRTPNMQEKQPHRGWGRRPCMDIYVDIFVKPGIKLDQFIATSRILGVKVNAIDNPSNDPIFTSDESSIALKSGSVQIASWYSRSTRISTISGSISGHYALLDLLSLSTYSGSVSVSVDPKDADPDSPAPAVYRVSTRSGSIDSRFPLYGRLPARDYVTDIQAHSASISGTYIHGSESVLRTQSGSITASVLPFPVANSGDEEEKPSTLTTESRSGHTSMQLLSPYSHSFLDISADKEASRSISKMSSTHTTQSGGLTLSFPPEWEGEIRGEARTGSVNLRGEGVQIIHRGHGPIGSSILAKKGNGDSRLGFDAQSGSVDIHFRSY